MLEQLGPVMLGLTGLVLTDRDRERLSHPATGGVILFTRNYADTDQLVALVREIRDLRSPLLIAVDHEGGPVQRFHEGFTALPAMRQIGEVFSFDPARGTELALDAGLVIATELSRVGLDFSFTPVLDRDSGLSTVIGERALHDRPDVITLLAGAFLDGLALGGMVGIGKHFPGHGGVAADSHHELPVDERSWEDLHADVQAFTESLERLAGIMPAHVVYPAVDATLPASFSPIWLQHKLRHEYGFQGAVLSDDLGMAGAYGLGDPAQRAWSALQAGCDMILICNDFEAMDAMLMALETYTMPDESGQRLQALRWCAPEAPVAEERLAQAVHRLVTLHEYSLR